MEKYLLFYEIYFSENEEIKIVVNVIERFEKELKISKTDEETKSKTNKKGGVFSNVVKGIIRGIFKSKKTSYKECEIYGITFFDALKIIISKKIVFVRRCLKKVSECRTQGAAARKQDARNMIRFLERDIEKLNKINLDYQKLHKTDSKLIENRNIDVELFESHLLEIKSYLKNCYKRKKKKRMRDSFGDSFDENSENLIKLPKDITISELPAIYVGDEMKRVKIREFNEDQKIAKLRTEKVLSAALSKLMEESRLYLKEIGILKFSLKNDTKKNLFF